MRLDVLRFRGLRQGALGLLTLAALVALGSVPAVAQTPSTPAAPGESGPTTVVVSGGGSRTLFKIALPKLLGDDAASATVVETESRDFRLSSLFQVLDPASFTANLSVEGTGIDPALWRNVGARGWSRARSSRAAGRFTSSSSCSSCHAAATPFSSTSTTSPRGASGAPCTSSTTRSSNGSRGPRGASAPRWSSAQPPGADRRGSSRSTATGRGCTASRPCPTWRSPRRWVPGRLLLGRPRGRPVCAVQGRQPGGGAPEPGARLRGRLRRRQDGARESRRAARATSSSGTPTARRSRR